jgi:hypothetical protein
VAEALGESLLLVFGVLLEPLLALIQLDDEAEAEAAAEAGLRGGKPLMVYTKGGRDNFAFSPSPMCMEVFVLPVVESVEALRAHD